MMSYDEVLWDEDLQEGGTIMSHLGYDMGPINKMMNKGIEPLISWTVVV